MATLTVLTDKQQPSVEIYKLKNCFVLQVAWRVNSFLSSVP